MPAERLTEPSSPILVTIASDMPRGAPVFIFSGDALGRHLYDYCREQNIPVSGVIEWMGDTRDDDLPVVSLSQLRGLGTREANLLISRRDYQAFLKQVGSDAFRRVYIAHPFAQALSAGRATHFELPRGQIFDPTITEAPSPQHDLDIFAREWMAEIPIPGVRSGWNKLFIGDKRLEFANAAFWGLRGMTILELGPYEGAHTYALEKAYGASSVTAIESNTRAFLRCLIVKNIFDLKNSKFLLGNFLEFLKQTKENYDLIFASGVLYHMTDPAKLLELMSLRSRRIFLWTHCYDEKLVRQNSWLKPRFDYTRTRKSRLGRYSFSEYCFVYPDDLQRTDHLGGVENFVYWLRAEDIVGLLRELGFRRVRRGPIDSEHLSGPNLCIVAEKFVWYDPTGWLRSWADRGADTLRRLAKMLGLRP